MYENPGNWQRQIAHHTRDDALLRAVIGPNANWQTSGRVCTLFISGHLRIAPRDVQHLLHDWGVHGAIADREHVTPGNVYALVPQEFFPVIEAQRDLMNMRLSQGYGK